MEGQGNAKITGENNVCASAMQKMTKAMREFGEIRGEKQ